MFDKQGNEAILRSSCLTSKDGITFICNSTFFLFPYLLIIACICYRNINATVKILPEVILPDSLHEVRDRSLDRYRSDLVDLSRPISQARRQRQQTILRRDAMMTVWPHWVHNQYNATTLSHRVKLQLSYLKLGM